MKRERPGLPGFGPAFRRSLVGQWRAIRSSPRQAATWSFFADDGASDPGAGRPSPERARLEPPDVPVERRNGLDDIHVAGRVGGRGEAHRDPATLLSGQALRDG